MKTITAQANEMAEAVSFGDRAKKFFLLSLDHVKATLTGEDTAEGLLDELDVLWYSFNEKEIDRMNEIGDSFNGMLRFVLDGVGVDPDKPVGRNEHGAWINAE